MAITHPTAVRNALADLVVDAIDAGSGVGKLVIMESDDTVLVTLLFGATAFGAAAAGVATANSIASVNATTGGTAAKFSARDSDDVEKFAGAVALSGSDLDITNTNINVGDPISITDSTLTYTAST